MDASASAAPDLVSEALDVPAADGSADALLVRPAGGGPFPGVVLHMDAYGLRPALRAHAERLAGHGFCVLVPNAYYRTVRAPVVENLEARLHDADRSALFGELRPHMRELTPEAVTADARAWVAFLRGHPDAADGPLGTVGYCMGGRQALRMAGELRDDVGAAASFHGGGLATDAPDSPHLAAVRATGELFIGHADNDGSMEPEQMARLTRALAESHVRHTAELFVGAAHGWTQTDTPAYDEASSERHWLRLTELFGRVLG
jgi:carboxymethylenebutenolidase